jgi:hypothetical protein
VGFEQQPRNSKTLDATMFESGAKTIYETKKMLK